MSTTIILRGFKVPFKVLDGFLLAHNIWETEGLCSGIAPFYNKDPDKTSTLLRNKVGNGDTKTRVFVPYKMSLDHASHGYVAYDWIMVFAQRRIKPSELSEIPPEGFEDLRREILSYSPETNDSLVDNPEYQNGLWVVITDERVYVPPELRQRMLVCIAYCNLNYPFACYMASPLAN